MQILLYNSSIYIAAPNSTLSPGVGVHVIAIAGLQPTSGGQTETLISVNTTTNAHYGASAITTSFVFQDLTTVSKRAACFTISTAVAPAHPHAALDLRCGRSLHPRSVALRVVITGHDFWAHVNLVARLERRRLHRPRRPVRGYYLHYLLYRDEQRGVSHAVSSALHGDSTFRVRGDRHASRWDAVTCWTSLPEHVILPALGAGIAMVPVTTQSQAPSASQTRTPSMSASGSASQTSVSGTSVSASASSSDNPSLTLTASHSQAASGSRSALPSSAATRTASVSMTGTLTASRTVSRSQNYTPSTSSTASSTGTSSAAQTSWSSTLSASLLPSRGNVTLSSGGVGLSDQVILIAGSAAALVILLMCIVCIMAFTLRWRRASAEARYKSPSIRHDSEVASTALPAAANNADRIAAADLLGAPASTDRPLPAHLPLSASQLSDSVEGGLNRQGARRLSSVVPLPGAGGGSSAGWVGHPAVAAVGPPPFALSVEGSTALTASSGALSRCDDIPTTASPPGVNVGTAAGGHSVGPASGGLGPPASRFSHPPQAVLQYQPSQLEPKASPLRVMAGSGAPAAMPVAPWGQVVRQQADSHVPASTSYAAPLVHRRSSLSLVVASLLTEQQQLQQQQQPSYISPPTSAWLQGAPAVRPGQAYWAGAPPERVIAGTAMPDALDSQLHYVRGQSWYQPPAANHGGVPRGVVPREVDTLMPRTASSTLASAGASYYVQRLAPQPPVAGATALLNRRRSI